MIKWKHIKEELLKLDDEQYIAFKIINAYNTDDEINLASISLQGLDMEQGKLSLRPLYKTVVITFRDFNNEDQS